MVSGGGRCVSICDERPPRSASDSDLNTKDALKLSFFIIIYYTNDYCRVYILRYYKY